MKSNQTKIILKINVKLDLPFSKILFYLYICLLSKSFSLTFLLFLVTLFISIQIPLKAFLYKITTADCKYTQMFGSNPEQQCRKILDKSHFQTVRKLGKGSFGHVILASKFTTSHNFYAIKCISLKKCMKDPHLKRYISQETKTMCSLNHPNIVRLQNSFSDCGYHFIVMEYCDLGNLLQYQAKLPQRIFSFGQALRVLHQVMRGVSAIHHRNIIHRDLKCENIFLQKNKNGSYTCKIGDFGLAKVVQDTTKTSCGTIYFMAPEVIEHQPYDHQADIWSIGVIFYYTLFGQYPFKSMNIQKQIELKCKDGYNIFQYQKNYELKYKKDQQKLRNFFQRVFVINPKDRITLNEMFSHSFFQSIQVQTTQDSTDDQLQQDVELQLQKIEFIQKVQEDLTKLNILQEVILSAFRFYLLKVMKTFLNQKFILQFLKEQPQSKLSKEILKKNQMIEMQMKMLIKFLQSCRLETNKIQRFNQGFNLETQDFSTFKQGYRNTVGKIYEQVHKRIPEGTKRAQMKFKIFCCHLINRVFKIGVKREIFPYYVQWMKQERKISKKSFDFTLFQQWIDNESNEKLVGSIEAINKLFYKKD